MTRWMEEGFQAKIKKDRGQSRATANGRRIPMKFKCRRRVFRGGQGKKVGRSKRKGNGDGRRGVLGPAKGEERKGGTG